MALVASEPRVAAGASSQTGILLINLGTPEAPTAEAVRVYLKEFLSDPRVVEIPRLVWWPILNFLVLPTRPKASAARYAQIWMREGSPLKVYTERQTSLLRGYLGERLGSTVEVDYAMRYGKPSIAEKLNALTTRGCGRVLLVPLYPQFSGSTTASVLDAAYAVFSRSRNQPAVRTIRDFHEDAGYIAALEASVRDCWEKRGRPDMLVMSFHGVPRRSTDLGDPYAHECRATGTLLASALGLEEREYRITFQSRFGRAEWLQPYTSEVLTALGQQKCGRVDVICPGFVCDCLETLEEIAIEGKAFFTTAGGRELNYIPCLNDRHPWIEALAALVERNLGGWVEKRPVDPAESGQRRALLSGVGG